MSLFYVINILSICIGIIMGLFLFYNCGADRRKKDAVISPYKQHMFNMFDKFYWHKISLTPEQIGKIIDVCNYGDEPVSYLNRGYPSHWTSAYLTKENILKMRKCGYIIGDYTSMDDFVGKYKEDNIEDNKSNEYKINGTIDTLIDTLYSIRYSEQREFPSKLGILESIIENILFAKISVDNTKQLYLVLEDNSKSCEFRYKKLIENINNLDIIHNNDIINKITNHLDIKLISKPG